MNFKRLKKVGFSKIKTTIQVFISQEGIIAIMIIIIAITIPVIIIILTSSEFGEVLFHCLKQKKQKQKY
jgi:Na+-transporting NADH:ubiquinone oxidoreductase subunit NqrB